jgi:hypothetical protein
MDKRPDDATLLDVLIDGFEKNEVLNGFCWRELPMPDEGAAVRKFAAFTDEAIRWKGPPVRRDENSPRRIAAWPDFEIRQSGRAVMLRARPPGFHSWWHDPTIWTGDPVKVMQPFRRALLDGQVTAGRLAEAQQLTVSFGVFSVEGALQLVAQDPAHPDAYTVVPPGPAVDGQEVLSQSFRLKSPLPVLDYLSVPWT